MANIAVKIDGLEKFKNALHAYPSISLPLLQNAMSDSVYQIQRNTIPLTPVDTGHLRISLARAVAVRPFRAVIKSNLPYALKQHESLTFKHKVGQAKFLEKGVEMSREKIQKNFYDAIGKALYEIGRRSK